MKNLKKALNSCLKSLSIFKKKCYTTVVNITGYDRNQNIKKEVRKVKEAKQMPTVFDVANWFLSKSPMTHKKLQKLCYYAQAWCYALKDRPFMTTEFQAWTHGPVSYELYSFYRGSRYKDLIYDGTPLYKFTPDDEDLLLSVWETYGDMSGNALEVLSHSEPPWQNARKGCPDANAHCTEKISPDDMKTYYRSIYIGDTQTEA